MMNDLICQQDLIAELQLENLFIEQDLEPRGTPLGSDAEPSWADTVRAIANIRAWRTYLPAPCVARMIEDGWQRST